MTIRDRLVDWWEVAVLERIDVLIEWRGSAAERLATAWYGALDGLRDRRSRLPASSPQLVGAVVVASALCGTALAVAFNPGGSGGSGRPAQATSAPGPFLQRLPTVAERLAADRARQRRRLAAARTARSQAAAAAALSGAYRRAASALQPGGRRGRPVVRALRVTAAAYAALGRASRAGARRPFSSARLRVRAAESRLHRALRGVDTGAT